MGDEKEILEVSQNRWLKAQAFESNLWIESNRRNSYLKLLLKFARAVRNPTKLFNYFKYRDFYCGDDWNYWWMKEFENYRKLPKSAEKCSKEMLRVTKRGGFVVIGQDLSNEEDLSNRIVCDDAEHPIKIHHTTIDAFLSKRFRSCLKKVLPCENGRTPFTHYGTYIYSLTRRNKVCRLIDARS